ncbi:MAG: hypothetical protein EP314_02560 [Bacteroidetes bacterium]|nr:MAG: hypothetical protein EP314_02560 [Bacteroidota bacterium]
MASKHERFQPPKGILKYLTAWSCFLLLGHGAWAQESGKWGEIHGNVQFDAQYYNPDSAIGAPPVPEKLLMNGFTNLIYTKGKFQVGLRYENYLNVLQGFDTRYQGQGITYRYATFDADFLTITVGNFYEQFGSGMIFRSYEERGLGFDNAMDGVRVKAHVLGGVYATAMIGRQRSFFTYGDGIVRGFDGEINLNETFKALSESEFRATLGGSYVSKYQKDEDPDFELPENVGAWAARATLLYKGFNLSGEYVYKINDPQATNVINVDGNLNKNYNPGNGILATLAYSRKGLGIVFGAKRIDNMDFRSDRGATGFNLNVNFLPALTKQHTYQLAASLYPYATQPNGEWAFQGEISYMVPRKSKLGGKYGMNILINYSDVHGLVNTVNPEGSTYTNSFFELGELYFRDFNVEINKKFTKSFKMTGKYLHLAYNKDVVQGLVGYGTIIANIGIVDATYAITSSHSLRLEVQGLWTKDRADEGHWALALLEYQWAPYMFVAVMNQWNYGNKNPDKQLHYPSLTVGYIHNATRITLGYGRQRAGIFCVGGICRNVPAANGVTLSITSSF